MSEKLTPQTASAISEEDHARHRLDAYKLSDAERGKERALSEDIALSSAADAVIVRDHLEPSSEYEPLHATLGNSTAESHQVLGDMKRKSDTANREAGKWLVGAQAAYDAGIDHSGRVVKENPGAFYEAAVQQAQKEHVNIKTGPEAN